MISLDEVMKLHSNSIKNYGGSDGVRDTNLLESAIARPYQSFGDVEFYPTPLEKAAAIIESIVKNHPFVDGNKRTGFLACYTLLYRSKIQLTATQEEAYQFVIDIASSRISFETLLLGFGATHNLSYEQHHSIIGGGNLGSAIAEGLISSGFIAATDIIITKRNIATLEPLQQKGVTVTSDNTEAVRQAEWIFLAGKTISDKRYFTATETVFAGG